MMTHSQSSSSEDLGAIGHEHEDNEDADEYQAGEEGDDEIENEDQPEEEEEEEGGGTKPSGTMFNNIPHSPARGIPPRPVKLPSKSSSSFEPPHSLPQPGPSSAPLLPFPPGFVPRASPSFKPLSSIHQNNKLPQPSHIQSSKQTEKISATGFCRYFLQGYCRDGKRCVFSHDAATLKRTTSDPQEYEDTMIPLNSDDNISNPNSQQTLTARSIYRSSSDITNQPQLHSRSHHHHHDRDRSSSSSSGSSPEHFPLGVMVSPPLAPQSLQQRGPPHPGPPPFASPTASIISDTGSERSSLGLFPSASPFTLLPSTPSIPVPFNPNLLNGSNNGTYSTSNPTSPFTSSLSPDTLGGLSTLRLSGNSYSHVTARGLTGKTISRSLSSRPYDSNENSPSFELEARSRSLTSTEGSSSSGTSSGLGGLGGNADGGGGWGSHSLFPRSAPSHFYTYDSPLVGTSSLGTDGGSILSHLTTTSGSSKRSSVESSPFLSSMGMPSTSMFSNSVPVSLSSSSSSLSLSSTNSILAPSSLSREEEFPAKLEELEADAKHADLDLKLVELALVDGPESTLLDPQISVNEDLPSSEPILENNSSNNSENSNGEMMPMEFVPPSFDPTDLNLRLSSMHAPHSAPIPTHNLLPHLSSQELLSESLSVNISSGEESPEEAPSSPQNEMQGRASAEGGGHAEDDRDQDDALERGSGASSKPIPIPGSSSSSPSYSSIVRNATSPLLASSSAPVTIKKSPALKKDDPRSILPVAALNEKKGRKVCSFFLQGICRYGQQCRHRHLHCVSDKCLSCGQTCGSSFEEQQTHLTVCTEVIAMEKERRESGSRKCGICHQLTLKMNRKFGLLISCNHSFCLQCIREWRGSSEHSRERVRACPICKVVSHYVIPCDRHVAEPSRKQRVIVEYKWRLGQIDCKHYNKGKSVCPFGEACFYRHEDASTTKKRRGPKTYSENIFDDDEEEDDEEAEEEENNEEMMAPQPNHPQHTTAIPTSRATIPNPPILKFAKKQIVPTSTAAPAPMSTPSTMKKNIKVEPKGMINKKINNNPHKINPAPGKYVKGKPKKK